MLRFLLLVAGALALALPAQADVIWRTYALRQSECDSSGLDPQVSIRGCTLIIRGNNVTGERRAAAYRRRGDHYRSIDDHDRALQDYSEAISLNTESGIVYYRRAELFRARGDYQAALDDFTNFVRLEPNRIAGYLGRCRTLATMREQLDRARADCDAALERALPEHVHLVHSARGYVGLLEGNFSAAWADYDAALTLSPMDANAQYGRGLAARALGRAEEAAQDLAAALRLEADAADGFEAVETAP